MVCPGGHWKGAMPSIYYMFVWCVQGDTEGGMPSIYYMFVFGVSRKMQKVPSTYSRSVHYNNSSINTATLRSTLEEGGTVNSPPPHISLPTNRR